MSGGMDTPKVFISYSWTNTKHVNWVIELAERLMRDGVLVVLDKWDLKEGQDKYVFMEQMVTKEDIKKVLVVCDRLYQKKADERVGGVGTESQIISPEVYEKTDQKKFIPLVTEYDEEGKPCLPAFLKGRIYLDFSSDDQFEESYEKLLRNLFDRPSLKKPPLGTPPSYLFEDEPVSIKTAHYVKQIKNALLNDKKTTKGLVEDYFEVLLASLEDYRIKEKPGVEFDDIVIESIERLLPLRNDFIDFIMTVFKYSESIDVDRFHHFFERLIKYLYKPEDVHSWNRTDFDNYKFFVYELFLYFIAGLIKLEKYSTASYFINSSYFFKEDNMGQLRHSNVSILNQHVKSLDYNRNRRLNLQRYSITADLVKQRANRQDIPFHLLIDADLILFYVTCLQDDAFQIWYPHCCVYARGGTEFFARTVSRKYVDKIRVLFNAKDLSEFKAQIGKIDEVNRQYARSYVDYRVPNIISLVNLDNLGSVE